MTVAATVPYFDDLGSYIHAALGFACTKVGAKGAALIASGFLIYQMAEFEPLENKFGDFAEFFTGALIGVMSKEKI